MMKYVKQGDLCAQVYIFTCDGLFSAVLHTVTHRPRQSAGIMLQASKAVPVCVLKHPGTNDHHCQCNDTTVCDSTTTLQKKHTHHFLSCRCSQTVTGPWNRAPMLDYTAVYL